MGNENAKTLRDPMLKCLNRMVGELAEKLQITNKLVQEKAGVNLGLEIISVTKHADDDFRIKVKGFSFTKELKTEEFKVIWLANTCPAHFHLLQWGSVFGGGYDFIYCCVVETSSENLAREIAIFTHHMQIPKVLSRI